MGKLLLNKTLPPITDLFIGDTFGDRGFKMLEELKKHFNPSGCVNAIAKLTNLCDLQQNTDEELVNLKARLTKLVSALHQAGVPLHPTLQVGFLLRALSADSVELFMSFRLEIVPSPTLLFSP